MSTTSLTTPNYVPRAFGQPVELPAAPDGARIARFSIFRYGWTVKYAVHNTGPVSEVIQIAGGYTFQFKLRPGRGPLFGGSKLQTGSAVSYVPPGEEREYTFQPSGGGSQGWVDVDIRALRRAGMAIYPYSAGGCHLDWPDGTPAGPAAITGESVWYEFTVEYL